MKTKFQNKDKGFIALMSVIIISAITISLIFTLNTASFYARFDSLDSEFKRVAEGMAESCVDQALLKLGKDYQYDPVSDPTYIAGKGVPVTVGSGSCFIKSILPGAPRSGSLTNATVITQGVYNNAFSDFKAQITLQNPTSASFVPLPSCYLWSNTSSIMNGQSATLGWSTSNATSFKIIAVNNSAYNINPASLPTGSQSIALANSETFVGTVTNASGSTVCTVPTGYIAPSIIVQPPATCADTVMIFDRTGSLSNADLSNERNAGQTLLSLYQGASPQGQVGIGSFGGLDGSGASIPTNGQLSKIWANLTSTLNSVTGSNSSVGSNLSLAIDTAAAELNGPRHDTTKAKVMIFVSDGEPNEPSSTVTPGTLGPLSPSANSQEASGDLWSSPTNAYSDGGGDSNDPVSENDHHRFYNFGFGGGSGLPSGSTVDGIEATVDAWATGSSVNNPANIQKSPTGMGSPNQWSSSGSAFLSDNSYASDSTNGHQVVYNNFGFSIPAGSTITGISVTTEAKVAVSSPLTTSTLTPTTQGNYTSWTNGVATIDEIGTPSCSSADSIITNTNNNRESVKIDISSIPNGATINSIDIISYDKADTAAGGTYKTFARLNGIDVDASTILSSGTTGGSSLCNSGKTQTISLPLTTKSSGTILEIGVLKTSGNNNSVRVGLLNAVVNYTLVNTGSLAISLSSDNGASWTTSESVNLTTAESITSPTGNSSTDFWGRSWSASSALNDFSNGKFALKIQNNTASGISVSLDQVTVNVYYTFPTPPSLACQIGVDLSWNGGTSWTSEKQLGSTLTVTETTYLLGNPTDKWTSSHTWGSTDFSNTNFRARVHAIDPGASCSDTDVDHLDWLRLKVYYHTTVTNTQTQINNLTIASANNAKASGIEIFTVRYSGDTNATAISLLRDSIATSPADYFQSPTTLAGITNIFDTIAKQVCPAALPPVAPPSPPSPPAPPPLPPNITINSWIETSTAN